MGPQLVTNEDEATCVSAASLSLLGQGTFSNGTESLDILLNKLELSGEIFSARISDSSCPSEVQTCMDALCGTDPYGVECGTCDVGYACNGGQCSMDTCPPLPPFSTHPFESLTDGTVYDCDGNPVQLHELCGAPVGYFNLLAGW